VKDRHGDNEDGYAITRDPAGKLYWVPYGVMFVDSGPGSPYYDVDGADKRDAHELSIFDRPTIGQKAGSAFWNRLHDDEDEKKSGYVDKSFDDYLIYKGVVYYHVHWDYLITPVFGTLLGISGPLWHYEVKNVYGDRTDHLPMWGCSHELPGLYPVNVSDIERPEKGRERTKFKTPLSDTGMSKQMDHYGVEQARTGRVRKAVNRYVDKVIRKYNRAP
jgi:hypothetical protein